MRSRRPAIARALIALVATVVVVTGVVGFVTYTSGSGPSQTSSTQGPGTVTTSSTQTSSSPSSSSGAERSGPISTYPASWTDVCGLPVHGNDTTNNGIASSFTPGVANFSLSQVYSDIVSSASFENVSIGLGWVTTDWGIQQDSGPGGSYEYAVGQFVLLNASEPDGFVQANYNLETGAVAIDYQRGLMSSCPAMISSSSGATLTEPSPAYYAVGAPVSITFYVVDDSVTDMPVSSSSSCLGSFTILQGIGTSGPAVYNSTEHGGCSGPPVNVQLNPGQSYNQTVTWNQTDDAGSQVPSGAYEVMGSVAGGGQNFSSPIGEVYIGTPPQVVNSSILRTQFYYQGNLGNSFVAPGQPVKVVWVLGNQGQQVYDLQTSACSYAYNVLNLEGAEVFSSSPHSSCDSQLQDNPSPPMGGISHVSYWNQTNNSGSVVAPGFYRVLVDLHVWSGGHEFNLTADSDLEITAASNPLSGEQIGVASSSICAANCGSSSPYLDSSVYANGNLTGLRMYLNGTLVGTMNYKLPCCELTYQVSFNTPINNSTTPILPGVEYDIVFVGTFQDGSTSTSWANPLNPSTR